MNLRDFVNMLLSVTDKVYQDEAYEEPEEYIVWTMTADRSLRADNGESECAKRINVRIFTADPFTQLPDKLKAALNEYDIAYEDMQYQFVGETKSGLKYGIYSTFCEVT